MVNCGTTMRMPKPFHYLAAELSVEEAHLPGHLHPWLAIQSESLQVFQQESITKPNGMIFIYLPSRNTAWPLILKCPVSFLTGQKQVMPFLIISIQVSPCS